MLNIKGGYQLLDLTNLEPFIIDENVEIGDINILNKIKCDKLVILKIRVSIRGESRDVITPLSSIYGSTSIELNSGYITDGLSRIRLLHTLSTGKIIISPYS